MKWLIPFLFFLIYNALSAQEFRNLGIKDGLSSHQAYDIIQDKNGFIWTSTKVGIDRYDGENIINYGYPNNFERISFQRIGLRTDLEKNLWTYTPDGKVFSFKEGKNQFELILNFQSFLKESILLNLYIDDRIWLCSNKGLWFYDPIKQKFKQEIGFRGESVNLIVPYFEGTYLVSVSNRLVEYNINKGTIDVLIDWEEGRKSDNIQSVLWVSDTNEIWIGTQSGNVLIYNSSSKALINLKDSIPELPTVPVNKIVELENNEIYIGSDGGGVFKFNNRNKKLLDIFRENEDDSNSLVGNGVQDLYILNSGSLLISSFTGGLNILNDNEIGFQVIRHEIKNTNSLRNNVVNSVLEDSDGDIWFGTNNGVSCWLKKSNKWIHFLDDSNSTANVILSLIQYNKKEIMAGSYGKGLYILSKKKGIVDHIYPGLKKPKQDVNSDYIVEVFRDSQNKLWTTDTFKDIAVYNPALNSYEYIPLRGVNSIQEKDDENVFVGTANGVYLVNIFTYKYKKILFDELNNQSLFVNSLNFDRENKTLWIATSGFGLLRLNVHSGEIKILNVDIGLPSNHIYAVLRYGENTIWASSEKGLIRYEIKEGSIDNFSINDGLSDESFYKNSRFKTKEGEFYFGSYQGVTIFNPEKIEFKTEEGHIFLEELRINNKKIIVANGESVLKKSLNQTKELLLKYNQSSFSIGFTTIKQSNSSKIKYSWKLEGQDQEWTIPSFNKRANYTNVSEGDFQFRLRAISGRSDKVIDERLVNIRIKPAPWNTLLARILFIIFFLIIVGLIFKYLRFLDIKKLSDAKIQFFTNTAHDIKTPLTLTSAPLSDLQKSENLNEHERYLLDLSISNISNLTSSVNKLLDFQKSDIGKSQLVLSEVDITYIIKNRVVFFSQIAESKNIKFKCVIEPKVLVEWIDVSKIEKVLDNLLSNAFKYTKENGLITLHLEADNSSWKISIKDNGIGISLFAQKSLFKRYYRGENAINSKISGTGIGLLLAQKYVVLHNGTIKYNSEENIGSEFIIFFKRGSKHYDKDVTYIDYSSEIIETSNIQVPVSNKSIIVTNEKNRIKLLLAEDNDDLRAYLSNTLSQFFKLYTAADGKEALEMVQKHNPDIIVSDIGMPEMDGLEFTNQVKNTFETSHIPIILLTAYSYKEDIIKGFKTGADEYITKPFDTSILLARIENIIHNRQKIKDRFLAFSKSQLKENTYSSQKDQEFIEKAIDLVDKNMSNDVFSKEFFAKEMFVSSSLLYKKLKVLTGQSPNEFVKIIKLKKALSLLNDGDKSINEVANLTGFSDAKYFSTSFKKFYGKSPSSFIKTNKG